MNRQDDFGTVVQAINDAADPHISFAQFCRAGAVDNQRQRRYFTHYYPLDERLPRPVALQDSHSVSTSALCTAKERRAAATCSEQLRAKVRHGILEVEPLQQQSCQAIPPACAGNTLSPAALMP